MATDIRVPALGESVTEATIGQWFKKVGDAVAADEPVVELETDKVTIEVPAPAAGVLEAISANPGDTVNVGSLIGAIGEKAAAAPPQPKPAASAPPPPPAPAAAPQPAAVAAPPAPRPAGPPPAPAAAKILTENGVSPDGINGSGRRGQVMKEDAVAAVAARPMAVPQQSSAASGSAAITRLSPVTAAPVAEAPKVAQAAPTTAPAAPAPAPTQAAPQPKPQMYDVAEV